jgi:hypothetical protein
MLNGSQMILWEKLRRLPLNTVDLIENRKKFYRIYLTEFVLVISCPRITVQNWNIYYTPYTVIK